VGVRMHTNTHMHIHTYIHTYIHKDDKERAFREADRLVQQLEKKRKTTGKTDKDGRLREVIESSEYVCVCMCVCVCVYVCVYI
jgi:hypothetical protein